MTYFDEDWAPRFDFGNARPLSGIKRIVVHTTENAIGTPAANVANYQLTSQTGSYHVLVDSTGHRLRENTDDWATWSTGNNEGNQQGLNLSFVAYSAFTREQWLAQDKMLRAGASVAAYWAKTHNIPVEKTDGTRRGFCGHGDLIRYGGTDHTDPGANFPWDVFIAYVKEYMGGAPAPTTSSSSSEGSSLMALTEKFFTDWMSGYLGPQINALQEVWTQLRGPAGKGWPQLGKDAQGRDLTPVDALAAIRVQLADLAREQQEIKQLLKGAK